MKIGDVARRAGISPSAIRYYEKAGLLPAPPRTSRQRSYDPEILGRLAIIRLAREAGFTVRETRLFLTGFGAEVRPSARWRTLARKKLAEIDAQMSRARAMKRVLKRNFRCGCPTIADCERGFARSRAGLRC